MSDFTEASDAHLIGAIVNGDAEAVRPLIERYRKPLGAVLQRALGSSPDVDDVFQETWIRVVRSAHRFDPAQRFSGWLFAIAWNLMKSRWSQRAPQDDFDLATLPSREPSAEERMLDDARARELRALVMRLPERVAQAILLRFFEELSENEVAARLGVPVGTVKSRIHYGLKRMRERHELQ
ncbi:MAG TPA: sigma-70 family RNA polymerase sigma factor [Thermoanaerobaculia bacterium]